jgi:transposase
MRTLRPYEPDQLLLLPPNLREWLPEGHVANFVSDVIDEMDLSEIEAWYADPKRGNVPYNPRMMAKVLVYGYCIGIRSSRRLARAIEEQIPFRVLAAGNLPDFRTIAAFRRRHLAAVRPMFERILELCRLAGLTKLGHVAVDGTKVRANASKHKAMSYGRMKKEDERLSRLVDEMLDEAERLDQDEDARFGADRRGDELPEELANATSRLKKIREAKLALEEKAREVEGQEPKAKSQRNFTDPESSIMKDSNKAFVQAYNCQAAVDASSQVIVAADVSAMGPDAPQLVPVMDQVETNMGERPGEVSADAGYFSEANIEAMRLRGIEPFIAPEKCKHGERVVSPVGRPPSDLTPKQRMKRFLSTRRGRARYGLRKETVEPVFGQIKEGGGFRQFLLRGIEKAQAEWRLVCLAHNLRKLHLALQPSALAT